MYGTGFFPTEKSNIYEIPSDGLYLTGTSEVALAGFHMEEILEAEALPLRYAAYSTCFRREAGAAGKDTHGMFRVHQFDKVEMFVYTRPDESWDEHEQLLAIEEELVQSVGLPYRVSTWPPATARPRQKVRPRGVVRSQGGIARHLVLQHDRLPGASAADPLRANGGRSSVHTLNGTAATDRCCSPAENSSGGRIGRGARNRPRAMERRRRSGRRARGKVSLMRNRRRCSRSPQPSQALARGPRSAGALELGSERSRARCRRWTDASRSAACASRESRPGSATPSQALRSATSAESCLSSASRSSSSASRCLACSSRRCSSRTSRSPLATLASATASLPARSSSFSASRWIRGSRSSTAADRRRASSSRDTTSASRRPAST